MRLIGITGRARAGKDTLAKGLIRHGWRRMAFADPLKEATAVIAAEPSHLFFDDVTKEEFSPVLGTTRRKALQLLGTEGVRNTLGPDVWVRRLLSVWRADGCPAVVVTDVRFDNEARAIREAGGHIVRVVRPSLEAAAVGLAGHASEAGVCDDLVDIEVVNDDTIDALLEEADKLHKLVEGDAC